MRNRTSKERLKNLCLEVHKKGGPWAPPRFGTAIALCRNAPAPTDGNEGARGASLSPAGLFSEGCRLHDGWPTFCLDKSTPPPPPSSRNFSDAARPPPPPPCPPQFCIPHATPCRPVQNEHIKAIWSHSFWAPVPFLSSPLPGTLILIACFFAVAFFSNLQGPEPFPGLRARRRPCLKV